MTVEDKEDNQIKIRGKNVNDSGFLVYKMTYYCCRIT